jgi:membrane-associated phospholipid phosphatase
MKNRIIKIVIVIFSMLLYVPVNRLISGGFNLKTNIDNYIPLLPLFVVPYLFGLVFWIFSILKINLSKDEKLIKEFNLMVILASIVSVAIYILIPTFVTRPVVTGTDMFSEILSFIYSNDQVYNAAPSGHTFYTILCFVGLNRLIPNRRYLWGILSVLIIISTVLTKQHNFLDIVIGIVFALGIIFISRKVVRN